MRRRAAENGLMMARVASQPVTSEAATANPTPMPACIGETLPLTRNRLVDPLAATRTVCSPATTFIFVRIDAFSLNQVSIALSSKPEG